jgi:hypothetical protein
VGKPKGLKQGAVTARVGARAAAAKSAVGKVKTGKKAKIDDSKVYRVTSRLNNVVRNSDQKTGVKRLNAIQVGARAKSFLARKEGGSVGMLNQKSQPEAYASVRKAMTKPPRYSTQKPNRNKPGRFNDLGQDKARVKARAGAKAATVKPTINRTRKQAAAAQLDRKRQTIENVKAIRGKQSYIAPEGINRKAVKINQRNLLTGGVDKVTAKMQTKVVGERNSPLSQFGRKTEARTERASTRLDVLIQAKRNTPKPRKASERAALAKIQKSISTVTRSFDSYRNARSGRRAKKP